MDALGLTLADLIDHLEADLPDADLLVKIGEAQRRARTLSGLSELLVGHYVTRAKLANLSWSQIGHAVGVSKQAAQERWNPQTFALFTSHARHAITLSHDAARARRHQHLGTEHLLLGILGEPEGLGAQILRELTGSTERIEAAIEAKLEPGMTDSPSKIPLTPRAQAAQQNALDQALNLRHDHLGTEHLLLGILAVADGLAARALGELDVGPAAVRALIAHRGAAHARYRDCGPV